MDTKKSITVLVADDHPPFRDGLCRLLEDEEGLKVVGRAGNCEQTVALTLQLRPDVAIIDVSMPGLSGVEAARQIRKQSPSTAVLMVSAFDYESFVLEALRAGARGYMLKNTPSSELSDAVRKVHKGELIIDSQIAARALQLFSGNGQGGGAFKELRKREMDILKLVAKDYGNREIGRQLVISERTVEAHLIRIFRKLGVRSRTGAVLSALKRGWLTIDDLP